MDHRALGACLGQAASSYREGREKPSSSTAAASGLGFDQRLEAMISSRLCVEEQLLLRVSSRARSSALGAARSNHLGMARQALDESASVRDCDALSAEARHVLTSFHEAVEAYLEFKLGRHDNARQRVFRALQADGTLITDYGYRVLELHRIQLGHNLMRIQARESPSEASALCSKLLRYIEGDEDSWPIAGFSNGASPRELPEDLLAAMFAQITGELALLLAGKRAEETSRLFKPLVPLAQAEATREHARHGRAKAWLRLKAEFIDGDARAFLAQVAAFLEEGPGEITLLWRAAATDLYDYCDRVGSAEAASLKREIAGDANAWRQLPGQLRAVFGSRSPVGEPTS